MPETIYECWTKATTSEGDNIRYSQNWLVARRGKLRVTNEGLECGNWHISYSDIQEAVLFSTRQMFIPCFILRVQTESKIYQFGLGSTQFWKGELPFPVRRERIRLRYSRFSIAVRLICLAGVAYFIWQLSK